MKRLLFMLCTALLRAQWGRFLAASFSISIGVALGLAIHLINRSALDEFSSAMGQLSGVANLQLKARLGRLPEIAYEVLKLHADVAEASPVIEVDLALPASLSSSTKTIKIIGLDVLRAKGVQNDLLPQQELPKLFNDRAILLSQQTLKSLQMTRGDDLILLGKPSAVTGTFSPPSDKSLLGVMDIAQLQSLLREQGWLGHLSRVDIVLKPGVDALRFRQDMARRYPAWVSVEPKDSLQKMSNLSRAYRVNLTVLALIALVSGAFMVYATMALAVRRQAKHQALLNVLGAPMSFGRYLVLSQGLVVGCVGSALGVAAGLALAASALHWIGGDLGGGFFYGSRPLLSVDPLALLAFFAIGVVVSVLGSLMPALQLRQMVPAQALRHGLDQGLSSPSPGPWTWLWPGTGLMVALLLLSLPAWRGIPLAAYAAIGLLIVVAVALIPRWVSLACLALASSPSFGGRWPSYWLASQRLVHHRGPASAAVSGIVASLALASAMAIMVHSFRYSVDQWLDTLLPADLYVRQTENGQRFSPQQLATLRALPGVARLEGVRSQEIILDETLPAMTLLAKDLDLLRAQESLPLLGAAPSSAQIAALVANGQIGIFASEAMADLYGWKVGQTVTLPGITTPLHVLSLWRDYVRQSGSVVMRGDDYRRLFGDNSLDDVLVWVSADQAQVASNIRAALAEQSLNIRSTQDIRKLSLALFDRSFALTYLLEAVAIAGALFGVACIYSGEALGRAREFGMLRHLGVQRHQVSIIFVLETAIMLSIAVLWSLALSKLLAWILIHRINPQSFHWSMDTITPWGTLLFSALAVLVLGVLTAWLATRSATSRAAVLAVREDW